ncbi:MAG: SH3 domain-containing protein [Cyclobacteriaceae bacterium]|nr:SH3 domain-containing protein [Cyclobacteriaceae bacterium]
MRFLSFFLILMIASIAYGQNQDVYQINVKSLVVHSKSNSDSKVIGRLNKGDAFIILSAKDDWHEIKFGGKTGYILGPSLNQSEFWTKRASSKEVTTKMICEDFTEQYDQKLNNYLQVNAGADRDLVIKLIKHSSSNDDCIRSIYVEAGGEVKIRNIPEGKYYVKVAYGNNWKIDTINGICYGKFDSNAIYEKGADLFDFNIVKTEKGHQVPSYQLTLEIITNNPEGKVVENQISEEEFNN